MTQAWIILITAGVFEVIWASAMKASDGFSKLGPSIVTGVTAFISFWLLAIAMKDLPLGTAYAVWVGIGIVGAAVVGMAVLGDAVTPLRVAGITLIVAGVGLLKIA